MVGTADHVAPEQDADSRRVDGRADVYALGCTPDFLLARRPPLHDQTVVQKLFAHQFRPLPPLAGVRPTCRPAWRRWSRG